MNRLLLVLFMILVVFCLGNCDRPQDGNAPLVKVGQHLLMKTDVTSQLPSALSSSDSLLYSENIIEKWIKEKLIFDVASSNLEDEMNEINKMVENYKQRLITYRYQDRLIKEKLASQLTNEDLLNFYHENPEKLKLSHNIIKGLFLKIPIDAPGIDNVKRWYKSKDTRDIEQIEKYSIQNAVIYDYFYDRWENFDAVIKNIPVHIDNATAFLNNHNTYEYSDSAFCYLLHIDSVKRNNHTAPFEYIKPNIEELLLGKRKIDFLKTWEEELYNEALQEGKIEINYNK